MVEEEDSLRPTMSALAILSCRPNSHPFQERHISLHEPVKIGRSVARARPSASNGIFDCKVLSRHHAMLWYENEKFYIQDTKSSNGTFINNQRLCKSGEESPMREIFSGDLIQFGVEVMENNRRGEKITHGCIIATITLYHPDGREAKPTPFLNAPHQPGIAIQSQDLYQLAHYLQEALHREKMLEQKLSSLQQLVNNTQEAAESGWQALIDEDKLLSRLEMLENQLHIYSKNHSEDTLRQELAASIEDKMNYETTAKESLRRVLQEKLDAVTKLSDLERSLTSAEDECSHLKEICESGQEELRQLAKRYQDQLKEVQELQEKLQEAEKSHQEELERAEKEKQELTEKLEDMMQQESTLAAKIESLQADNDFAKEQLAAMKAKLESMKETNQGEDKVITLGLDDISSEDIIPITEKDSGPENLEDKLRELQAQIEVYKAKLEESDVKLKESRDKIEQLQKELEMAQLDSRQYLAKMTSLEEKVKLSDLHMNQMMENALDGLKLQLKESQKQNESSNDLIQALEDHIQKIENQLHQQQNEVSFDRVTMSFSDTSCTLDGNDNHDTNNVNNSESMNAVNGYLLGRSPIVEVLDSNLLSSSVTSCTSSLSDFCDSEKLKEAQEAQKKAEAEIQKYKDEIKESTQKLKKSGDEVTQLKTQLFDSQQLAKERADLVTDLQDQLKKAEAATKEVKQQILELRDGLLEEQEQTRLSHEAMEKLQSQLETERTRHKQTLTELEESRSQLLAAQQSAKQSHNEAEQMRNKAKHLQEELEAEKKERHATARHSHGESPYTGRQSARSKEFTALKEECSNLRKRIQAIEAEMKMSRKENLQLSSEYNKLQESYKHLEALKTKLASSETAWRMNLTDAQKDAEKTKQEVREPSSSPLSTLPLTTSTPKAVQQFLPEANKIQLQDANEELVRLRAQCQEYSQKMAVLSRQVTSMETDYCKLAERSKMLSFCSSIPLLMLLFAILIALYPTLEHITATYS
ncbi:sarcolemmal membrane-associated protein-like isoform X2 [Pomacea canaliculata]|uniref:sarcolemmal membrane-associated protein-like isoform X2 n=1 Tax=Pomacea canaliculata TaxID=400727 RepID=UPI000D73C63A|nr:sarcolemmal membrane-associated protein-like isoform X2 [Pomacea canaliculata]